MDASDDSRDVRKFRRRLLTRRDFVASFGARIIGGTGYTRFVDGLKEWNGRWICTGRGLGNLMGIRFNCRPEVSLLTLQ